MREAWPREFAGWVHRSKIAASYVPLSAWVWRDLFLRFMGHYEGKDSSLNMHTIWLCIPYMSWRAEESVNRLLIL
ncbi:MAG: hypothetical protein QXR62_02795 [Candidatus Bathyarchaeia archaeon]|nr:hypothetical protein [Candidatus Bathyarchaeota archaeon]